MSTEGEQTHHTEIAKEKTVGGATDRPGGGEGPDAGNQKGKEVDRGSEKPEREGGPRPRTPDMYSLKEMMASARKREKEMLIELVTQMREFDGRLREAFVNVYELNQPTASAPEDQTTLRIIELQMHMREFDRRLMNAAEMKRLAGNLLQDLGRTVGDDWTEEDDIAEMRQKVDEQFSELDEAGERNYELQEKVDDLQEELARRDVERKVYLKFMS